MQQTDKTVLYTGRILFVLLTICFLTVSYYLMTSPLFLVLFLGTVFGLWFWYTVRPAIFGERL